MSLPTNFLSLPVETGLEILRQLSPSDLLRVFGSSPQVYLKYRDFIPELVPPVDNSSYIVVSIRSIYDSNGDEHQGNYISRYENLIDIIGNFTSKETAIQEAIKYSKNKWLSLPTNMQGLEDYEIYIVEVPLNEPIPPEGLKYQILKD